MAWIQANVLDCSLCSMAWIQAKVLDPVVWAHGQTPWTGSQTRLMAQLPTRVMHRVARLVLTLRQRYYVSWSKVKGKASGINSCRILLPTVFPHRFLLTSLASSPDQHVSQRLLLLNLIS